MEPRIKKVEDWISDIDQSNVKLPRFQRDEAWRHAQIVGLFENILRKPPLPVGTLLTLEVGDKELFKSRPIVGAPQKDTKPSMHLLDGQQRVTALWRSLSDDYDDVKLFVSLDDEAEEDEAQEDEAGKDEEADDGADTPSIRKERRWDRKGTKMPVWADDPAQQFKRRLIALDCLRPGSTGEKKLKEWTAAVKASGGDLSDDLNRIYELRQRIAGYIIPFLQLGSATSRETALDVFIKMNTSASPLKDYDIVVAQLEEASGTSLPALVEQLLEELPEANSYGRIQDIILSVAALVDGRPPLKKTYLDPGFGGSLGENWEKIRLGVRRGVEFLRDEAIFNEKCLPSDVAVYLICALWAEVPEHGVDEEGNARTLLRKVLWRICYTERYGKTSATRSFADYKTIKACLVGGGDEAAIELFDTDAFPLPSEGELISAGWPSRKDRLPRAILATTLRAGGLDFADGKKASAKSLASREYHHLFPVAILGGDRADERSNKALNCALISWRTNRKIAAKTPEEYIKMRADASKVGEDEVRARLKTHLISYKKLTAGDYDMFLASRAKRVAKHMKQLCEGMNPK